jgi:hypothetical protein
MRVRPTPADLVIGVGGCVVTLLAAYLAATAGAEISVGLAASIALFLGTVAAFMIYPHIAISGTIVLFALVPLLKVFVAPEIGAVKDAVVIAAAVAAVAIFLFERRRIDRWVGILVAILLGLYVINVGSGHGTAWAQGVRLTSEPLILLLVGMVLPEPQRTFRWALTTLIATACLVAAYGIVQQIVGKWTLVFSWGYSFEQQVRSLGNGQLRSFGTLDDPFAYAASLLFGLAGVMFHLRRGPIAWGAGLLITAGLVVSFSRTAALIFVGFAGLVMWRRGLAFTAMLAVVAVTLVSALLLINAQGTQSSTIAVPGQHGTAASANVVLNGRISAWAAALGDQPAEWLMGRGVGEVGTAAARSNYTLAPAEGTSSTTGQEAVDSGYLATIADVGFVGLGVILALFARLIASGLGAAKRGLDEGWFGLALMATLLIDALTRASFTGFPTAFLGLLLVGVSIASAAGQETVKAPRDVRP